MVFSPPVLFRNQINNISGKYQDFFVVDCVDGIDYIYLEYGGILATEAQRAQRII